MTRLEAISKIADTNPDSALLALAEYESKKHNWSKGDRMHFELVKMKSQNKSGMKIKSDSVLNDVVTYFDDNARLLPFGAVSCKHRRSTTGFANILRCNRKIRHVRF